MRFGVWFIVALSGCGVSTPRCPEGMSVKGDRCACDAPRFLDGDGDGFGSGPALAACSLGPRIVTVGSDCDDADEARHPFAEEECNGVDDDCDGVADEDFECPSGGEIPCVTACGTEGRLACTDACTLPAEAECAPPTESCNGVDDDCDGLVDEGVRELVALGTVSEDAAYGAMVTGFDGGMIVVTRGVAAAGLLVLDRGGARLRTDRTLDPSILTPRIARRKDELLVRGAYASSPPRPFCGALGPAPDYALEPAFCDGELPLGFALTDVLADGYYEAWFGEVEGVVHGGVVGAGPASVGPLSGEGAPLTGDRAFGVSLLGRVIVQGAGELAVFRRGELGVYALEVDLGPSIASAVTVVDGETSMAQVRSNHFLVRRYGASFGCASVGYSVESCNEGGFVVAVSVAGESPISIARIGRRTFVAYTAEEGARLGFLELDEKDEDVTHVLFAEGEGPFVEVFVADVGEALPRVLARTAAGALRLYAPECPPE